MAYDCSLPGVDPTKYFQIEYTATPEPVPAESAAAGVVERCRVHLVGDEIELYLEKRRGDYRVLLPNGMIQLCTGYTFLPYLFYGIAIGRAVMRDMGEV